MTASVWVLSPVGVAETGNFKPPAYDGFWTEQLEVPRELTQQIRKRDGLPLRAYLLQRIALFPTRAGPLELGTARHRPGGAGRLGRPLLPLRRRAAGHAAAASR